MKMVSRFRHKSFGFEKSEEEEKPKLCLKGAASTEVVSKLSFKKNALKINSFYSFRYLNSHNFDLFI